MPVPDPTPFWKLYWAALSDPMLIVLIVCALVSLGIEMQHDPAMGWTDGAAIIMAVQVCM